MLFKNCDIVRVSNFSYFPFFFFFESKSGKQKCQTLHFLQSFSSGFLPFMLLIELFWWSIKLSFLICLQICQVSNSRKVQNQWWVEHFQIIFNKCFLYWSHLQILQLKVNLNNWEFTKVLKIKGSHAMVSGMINQMLCMYPVSFGCWQTRDTCQQVYFKPIKLVKILLLLNHKCLKHLPVP